MVHPLNSAQASTTQVHSVERKAQPKITRPAERVLKAVITTSFKHAARNPHIDNLELREFRAYEKLHSNSINFPLTVPTGDKDYTISKRLGEGMFGRVFHAIIAGKEYALKINRDPKGSEREIKFLKQVAPYNGHGHIVQLVDSFVLHKCMPILVIELAKIDLLALLKSTVKEGFPLRDVQKIMHQLFLALSTLNQASIIHTDIKPANIMVELEPEIKIKIIDFNLSRSSPHKHPDLIQTPIYRSPEAHCQAPPYTSAVDVWSIGCVAIELCRGNKAFFDIISQEKLFEMHIARLGPYPSCLQQKCHPTKKVALLFARKLSYPSVAETLSAIDESKKIPSATNFPEPLLQAKKLELIDLVEKTLKFCPDKRITVQEALQHPFLTNN